MMALFMKVKCSFFLHLKVAFLIVCFLFPLLAQAHSIGEWLTAENLARLQRGEFLSDEEREAWLKLSKSPEVLRKIIEYTHPEYLRSKSLRDGILSSILGPLEKEEESIANIDVSSDLSLSLEDLPGMGRFLAAHAKTEEEIAELKQSLADKIKLANAIADEITATVTETVKQRSTDCP